MSTHPASSAPSVRRMRRGDEVALSRMMARLAAFHGDKSVVSPQHFVDHCLKAGSPNTAWIATAQGKPVGFAITYDWMNFVRGHRVRTVDLLFVEAAFRGQGIGHALLDALTRDATRRGIGRIDVTAQKANKNANAFYRAYGFEKRPAPKNNRYALLLKKRPARASAPQHKKENTTR